MRFSSVWLLAFALIALVSCGEGAPPLPETANSNFQSDGFAVRVEQTSLNTYLFTVVENSRWPNAVFTVYGLSDASELGSFHTPSKMRLAHLINSSQEGSSFEVTFNDDDAVFAIYHDDWDGFGWIYSTGRLMVQGQFRSQD